MNDFWDLRFVKKEEKKSPPPRRTKKVMGIDGLCLAKKPSLLSRAINNEAPKLKRPLKNRKKVLFWLGIFLTTVFIGIVAISGFWATKASQNKINILKLFRSGKYLVLFQNNAEMRPSGGFIGSFAIIEFSNYKIKNINFNTNIYKLDQAFTSEHFVPSPMPLALINNNKWALRDSNFAASYPEAASQVEWFYNQESGESVDGVIAINASVVNDLLKITGPINLSNYDTSISSDNFFTELTTQIEKDYYQSSTNRDVNEPKSILKDLLPELAHRLMQQNKIELIKKIYSEIEEKQVLFYSNDSNIQNAILAENWGGEIRQTPSDYLTVNNANVGGNKSSLSIKESLDYKVSREDGGLIANLTITRSHFGTNVWPNGINYNYARILVPSGSTLLSTELNGKDILNKIEEGREVGKTYFALTFATIPGTSDVVNLKYALPLSDKNYSLLVQKQPGNLGDNLVVKFENKLLFEGILNNDQDIKES